MGCSNSITYAKSSCTRIKGDNHRPLKVTFVPSKTLSLHDTRTVRETWCVIRMDLPANGMQVFLRIFELCPEAKKLFSVDDVRHSELVKNATIKRHGTLFMTAIGAAVEYLGDFDNEDNKFREVLLVLGKQHKQYTGFHPEYFEVFHDALLWQWERCMGIQFTQEVSDAWSHVLVYIMDQLKEGYYSTDIIRRT